MAENCPTCGVAVRVVSDYEGTSHYEPLSTGAVKELRALLEHREREAVVRVLWRGVTWVWWALGGWNLWGGEQ